MKDKDKGPAPKITGELTAAKQSTPSGQIGPKAVTDKAWLRWDYDSIAFPGDVPVGGNVHLILYSDGTYEFTGHFHDSGGLSYDTLLVFVVKDANNQAYTFIHKNHVGGSIFWGGGDSRRNDDWSEKGQRQEIAANFNSIARGKALYQARMDWDVLGAAHDLRDAIGIVIKVVKIVGEAFAL
jgi:hypothetical protein